MSTTAESIARELGDLVVRIERLESILISPHFPRPDSSGRQHVDRVEEVMRARPGEWLSVRELALGACISLGAARFVVYKFPDRFEKNKLSPRRCKWRMRPKEAPAHG